MTTYPLLRPGRHSETTVRRPASRFLNLAVRAGKGLLQAVLTGVCILAVVVFLFLAVGPRVLGYQTSTMLTGSMAPMINPGDVVVSVPTQTQDLQVGDVITYHIPVEDQRVETHRITELDRTEEGITTVRTKGDANNGPDPWTATLTDDHIYTTAAVVPYLGDAIRALRSPVVGKVLLYGAPTALVVMLLASIWARPTRPAADIAGTSGTAEDGRA